MNLSEMRQLLVEQTGYTGLVTDAIGADYSDKAGLLSNATYFINSGVRWLERRWPGKGNELRFRSNLLTGEFMLDLPYIQFVKRLDISDGATITHPRMVSYDEMRSLYAEPYSLVDSGLPVYWSWYPRPHISLNNAIVNGSFNDGLTGWTSPPEGGGVVSVSNGVLSMADTTGQDPILYQRLSTTYPQEQEVTISVATIPNGIIILAFAIWDDAQQTYTAVTLEQITTAGSHTLDAGSGGNWDTIAVFYLSTGTSTATINSIELEGVDASEQLASYSRQLIFMPPASEDYTVDFWGAFASTPLVNDNSYNWWTVEHPDLVVNAARAVYERQGHRNVSGAKVFEESCEQELARLYSEYRFSLYSGMAPEDLALNG